jgi:hypothetical protein
MLNMLVIYDAGFGPLGSIRDDERRGGGAGKSNSSTSAAD